MKEEGKNIEERKKNRRSRRPKHSTVTEPFCELALGLGKGAKTEGERREIHKKQGYKHHPPTSDSEPSENNKKGSDRKRPPQG